MITLTFVPNTHAASLQHSTNLQHSTVKPIPNDAPDIDCLDVAASNVSGQKLVTGAAGASVQWTLSLYVISECPVNHIVTNIHIVGATDGVCPSGSLGHANTVYTGPYGIYAGGGFGDSYTLVTSCIVNGGKTVAPSYLNVTVTASGSYPDGQVGQDATSNIKQYTVWG